MDSKLKRTPGIYLTGFMGSGKTTVGRALADKVGWDFVDLDTEIVARERAAISEIFDARGEAEFRRIETEVIRSWVCKVARGMPSVVALGGGAFVQPENLDLLEQNGISIWLDCPIEVVHQRIAAESETRPLARDTAALQHLYEQRRAAYSRASYRIDADCDVDRAVQQILDLPFWK
jgi:shikimate kinase